VGAKPNWVIAFPSQAARSSGLKVFVCVVLLVCVLIIVIAPEVDLPPTTLRAQHAISSLLIQLAALAFAFSLRIQTSRSRLDFVFLRETHSRPLLTRLSIICARLCWHPVAAVRDCTETL